MTRFVLLCALASVGFADQADAQTFAELPPIRPGDRVEIIMYPPHDLNGQYRVTAEGTLLHPVLDHVQVANVALPVARQRIEEVFRLEFRQEPKFTFEPLYRVYVGGTPRQGEYFFRAMTISQAIVDAGGSTAPDRRHRIRLIRNGEHIVASMTGGKETTLLQMPIESGDQILIEERPTFARNYLGPTLQAVQTLTMLVTSGLLLSGVFNN